MAGLGKILVRILLFSSPFLLIIASYIALDPFKVLLDNSLIEPDYRNEVTDYRRVEMLLDNYEEEHYNTFTFGNSQIKAFQSEYPSLIENSSYSDLHNPGESIWNIYKKIKLVDSLGLQLDHVLIIMNGPLIGNVRNSNPAYYGTKYVHHPSSSGESWQDFHLDCFGFYIADFYFIKYLDYNIFDTHRAYMEGVIPKGVPLYEKGEKSDPIKKSPNQESNFYQGKKETIAALHLDNGDRELLLEIDQILDQHGTNLCLIFPPNKEIEKMNPEVIADFQNLFGERAVFDFTGKNSVVSSKSDFIDDVHFKPSVAKRILWQIREPGFEF